MLMLSRTPGIVTAASKISFIAKLRANILGSGSRGRLESAGGRRVPTREEKQGESFDGVSLGCRWALG